MFGAYVQDLGSVLDLAPGLFGVAQTNKRALGRSTAQMQSIWFKFGESNRYSRSHQSPIPIDSIPVYIPDAVRRASHQLYQHGPVNSVGKEIRLLELLPERWSKSKDFIACRLVRRSLDDGNGLRYESLSYCWGRAARNIPLFVVPDPTPEDGSVNQALLVTPQLHAVLRRLRLESSSRYLWIDQVCIDQANNKEKGEQVLLMGDIYARSRRTIIWLGEEDSNRAPVESLLRIIPKGDKTSSERDIALLSAHLQTNPESAEQLAALTNVLNREWFTRAWIFQEAVLGNDLRVCYGGLEVPFSTLERLVNAVKIYQYENGGYARSIMNRTVGCGTAELIQHARGPNACGDEECIAFKPPNLLQTLFEAFQRFRATDDKDLIYAFLSSRFQTFSLGNQITPNYSQPVELAWTDAARRIIAEARNLDILAAARGGRLAKYPSLPSWVPDWSDCFRFARPIYAPDLRSSFDACGGRNHESIETNSAFQLCVRGKVVRTVAWTAPLNFKGAYYRDGIAAFLAADQHASEVRAHLGIQQRRSRAEIDQRWPDLRSSVLRTLLADGAFGHVQPLDVRLGELDRIMNSEAEIMENKAKMDAGASVQNLNRWRRDYAELEKLWGWGLIAQMKVLFTTAAADGSTPSIDVIDLGLAATAIEEGDCVTILHGSRVPIVLRKVGMGWKVISQCYCEGWMYGKDEQEFWSRGEADVFVLV